MQPLLAAALSGYIERVGKGLDILGVAFIAGAIMLVGLVFAARLARRQPPLEDAYLSFRHAIGRGILLGLEVLVAADIIRTVAVEPTFRSVGVLAGIVVIRTFLSFSLEMEISGRWPWQSPNRRGQGD